MDTQGLVLKLLKGSPQKLFLWTHLLLIVVLSGCATPQTKVIDMGIPLTAENLNTWAAQGKISLRAEGKVTNANLIWENNYRDYNIRIFGPVGIGTASLKKNENGVTLQTKDGVFESDSGEALLRDQLNLRLPIKEMHSWIKGLADPDKLLQSQWLENPQGEYLEIQQSKWKIQFENRSHVPGLAENATLPGKIKASFEGNDRVGPLKLIIVIKEWTI